MGSRDRCAPVSIGVLSGGPTTEAAPKRPNILFIIMDDIGIDQMPAMDCGLRKVRPMPIAARRLGAR